MKSLFAIALGLLLVCGAAHAKKESESVKKAEFICEFSHDDEKRLNVDVYGPTDSEDWSSAVVTVYKYTDKKGNKKILKQYEMNYVVPKKPSLFLNFSNKAEYTALSIFTDDMGSMSSLTVGDNTEDLTCGEGVI